jgi:hypothetical protein
MRFNYDSLDIAIDEDLSEKEKREYKKKNVAFTYDPMQPEIEKQNYIYTAGQSWEDFAKANKIEGREFVPFHYWNQCDNLIKNKNDLEDKVKDVSYDIGKLMSYNKYVAKKLKSAEVLKEKLAEVEKLEVHPKNYHKIMNLIHKQKIIKRKEIEKQINVPILDDDMVIGYMIERPDLCNKLDMLRVFVDK